MDLEEESPASKDVADSDPIQEALNNNVILENILKTSTNPKNCRLVCKKWNDTILSQTPPRLTIILQNVFRYTPANYVPQMERRLAKDISIEYKNIRNQSNRRVYAINYKGHLLQFCKDYGDAVEHLHFKADEKYFSCLQHVLENNLFPNLQSLEGSFFTFTEPTSPFNLQTMPKLQVIKIRIFTKSFLQLLINNAPNLQEIEIVWEEPFFFDFSQNNKLKSLLIKHFNNSEGKIIAEGLKRTLVQTAQSLEKLKINFSSRSNEEDVDKDENGNKSILVPYPIMPKLSALELNSNCSSQIGRHFDNLGPNLLPNLKYLKLSNNPFETNWWYHELTILEELAERKGSFQHAGLVKLALHQVENPDLLKDIRSFFPNIQSLEVEFMLTEGKSRKDILVSLIKALIELKLKTIKIIIPFTYDILELVQALETSYEQLFEEGLKQFYLKNLDKYNTDSLKKESYFAFIEGTVDPITTFEKILLHMKKVQGLEVVFQNFMFNAATVQRISGFIAENKIPLTFK